MVCASIELVVVVVVTIGRMTLTRDLYIFRTFVFIVTAMAASAIIVIRMYYLFIFFYRSTGLNYLNQKTFYSWRVRIIILHVSSNVKNPCLVPIGHTARSVYLPPHPSVTVVNGFRLLAVLGQNIYIVIRLVRPGFRFYTCLLLFTANFLPFALTR